jgi:hypothetical protein
VQLVGPEYVGSKWGPSPAGSFVTSVGDVQTHACSPHQGLSCAPSGREDREIKMAPYQWMLPERLNGAFHPPFCAKAQYRVYS